MRILITGGTGFIGKKLIQALIKEGHSVTNLTTRKIQSEFNGVKNYFWNPESSYCELPTEAEFDGVIHLAGFSVSNRWTKKNKLKMVESRLLSTRYLCKLLSEMPKPPNWFIGASAVGYYANSEEWQDESSKKGNGFLSDLTAQWELAADLEKIKIRKVHIRIGIVLDSTDGALKKMTPLFNWRLGSVLGSGGQFMSWIHLSDLVSMFLFCASNESVVGIVNGTAPEPVTNRTFTEAMEQALQKKQFAPSVPSWLLKLVMGEMSTLVLMSQRCSAKKITNAGFNFQFNTIQQALNNIYGKA